MAYLKQACLKPQHTERGCHGREEHEEEEEDVGEDSQPLHEATECLTRAHTVPGHQLGNVPVPEAHARCDTHAIM